MKSKTRIFSKWYIVVSIVLIIAITVTTIGFQFLQVNFSADDYENKLQNQAAKYLTEANDYISQGLFDRALERINMFFHLYPDNEEGYIMRASIYTGNGEYDKAIEDFTHAIALNPNVSDYYLQRGCLYILLNDFDHAQEDFNSVISLNNEDPYALLLIAQIYYEKKEYQKAIDTYDIYLADHPDTADVLAQQAYLYSMLNDVEHTISKLRQAYDTAPSYEYAVALAQSYALIQNYKESIHFATLALKENDSDSSMIKLRADSSFLLEDYQSAFDDYTSYLLIVSQDETAAYQQCICCLQLGNYDEALKYAEALLTYASDKEIKENTQNIVSYLKENDGEISIKNTDTNEIHTGD